ncbi:MAG: DUF1501 domain-containing protein, partial [Chloroflexota bacterium]
LSQSRRDFLKTTVGALAAAPVLPHMMLNSALAQKASSAPTNGPILVVVQLSGGNDGLNMIVPFSSSQYYQDRPTINVPAKNVIPIDNSVGFNPNLKALKPIYDQGKLAIVQGVGYHNPTLSHFQGTTIWETADPSGLSQTGWLGRFMDAELAGDKNPFSAIALGPMLPQTLISLRSPATSLDSVKSFRFLLNRSTAKPIMDAYATMYRDPATTPQYVSLIRSSGRDAQQGVADLQALSTKYTASVQYPKTPLGYDLQLVAQIISAGLGTRIFHVTLGGFDDHVAEVYTHFRLMQTLGDALAAFYQDITGMGKADQITVMSFSEFGRRVKENAGRGTDHGTAAPMLVMGGKVKGGLLGQDPILSTLDGNGDLEFGIDFRSVYGSILDKWMGASSQSILGGSYESLPLF